MLKDISETPTYRRLVAEGREVGREEGVLLGIRQSAEVLVQAHFPSLRSLAKKQLEMVTDLETLRQAVIHIGGARTAREVKQYLLNLSSPLP